MIDDALDALFDGELTELAERARQLFGEDACMEAIDRSRERRRRRRQSDEH